MKACCFQARVELAPPHPVKHFQTHLVAPGYRGHERAQQAQAATSDVIRTLGRHKHDRCRRTLRRRHRRLPPRQDHAQREYDAAKHRRWSAWFVFYQIFTAFLSGTPRRRMSDFFKSPLFELLLYAIFFPFFQSSERVSSSRVTAERPSPYPFDLTSSPSGRGCAALGLL